MVLLHAGPSRGVGRSLAGRLAFPPRARPASAGKRQPVGRGQRLVGYLCAECRFRPSPRSDAAHAATVSARARASASLGPATAVVTAGGSAGSRRRGAVPPLRRRRRRPEPRRPARRRDSRSPPGFAAAPRLRLGDRSRGRQGGLRAETLTSAGDAGPPEAFPLAEGPRHPPQGPVSGLGPRASGFGRKGPSSDARGRPTNT